MPTYQYECSKCGDQFEIFQPMKDSSLQTCPKDKCARKPWGRGKVRRQPGTGAGLIFKGSGFYTTDYRSEGYKTAAKKEKDATSGTPPATPKKEGTGSASPSKAPASGTKPADS